MADNTRAELWINSWGPIEEGSISVKPLTVFIGPNNTGKSYTAMLYYGIMRGLQTILGGPNLSIIVLQIIVDSVLQHLEEKLISGRRDLIEQITLEAINEYLEDGSKAVLSSLERTFSSKLENLVKQGSQRAEVSFRIHGKSSRVEGSLTIASGGYDARLSIKVAEDLMKELFKEPAPLADILSAIRDDLPSVSAGIYYLPASRSGVLQSYKTIASAILSAAPIIPLRGAEIPGVSGPIADFLTAMINIGVKIPEKRSEGVGEVLRYLEEEILGGEVLLETEEAYGVKFASSILYKFGGRSIPITGASSSVGELSPLAIFLKYLVRPGDTLIIEEPEAHLHPRAQVRMARLISLMVNKLGLSLIITTHSPELLAALNELIALSTLEDKDIDELGYKRELAIHPDTIAVYRFRREAKGAWVERLNITDEGIPEDEFLEVSKELYESSMKIYYKRQRGKSAEEKGSGC